MQDDGFDASDFTAAEEQLIVLVSSETHLCHYISVPALQHLCQPDL